MSKLVSISSQVAPPYMALTTLWKAWVFVINFNYQQRPQMRNEIVNDITSEVSHKKSVSVWIV
jgi:hypothetical protein